MIIRQILILIISALLLFFSYRFYKYEFCPACCVAGSTIGVNSAAAGPLVFNWNSEEPITKDGYDALKASIFSKKNDAENLEITGHYFADEKNDTEYENLGFARAFAIGQLFAKDNPDLKIITKSELVGMKEGVKSNEFASMTYRWLSAPAPDAEDETTIISSSGDAKILFPFNSSNKIDSPEVSAYLDNVAARLKNDTKLEIYIVGHTDSLGEPGANRRLSERRAKKIRDILKSKGVRHKQIVPSGRGEADPVSSNKSDKGRQENRRVDITIK